MGILIHEPNSDGWPEDFNIDTFMGTWYVTHSTLPLWKSKKDVSITYTPLPSHHSSGSDERVVRFLDTVSYRSSSFPSSNKPSTVEGVDTAIPTPSASSTTQSGPPTRFKWRGKGWLTIASSRWQVLGYSNPQHTLSDTDATNPPSPAWALTFFETTLFTPAGLDIYARSPQGLPEDLVQEIIQTAQQVEGQVGKLAHKFFKVDTSEEEGS
ncbi:hypothetical protein JAAARDRAFT_207092 [Jaapia argillacea MUCL 33604]|uniref:Uncharacterized protein n=1 Tax=Jaapia argillacea MUCL 33604 TaxID=933084 RepID=A0A067PRZ1_9AGAM|nr:hypothetical protein JAAARDRAFT_207092 [Jaapia argillacea MUCL 33604]